jgi:uncharacterized protein YidB (DUF937 family)
MLELPQQLPPAADNASPDGKLPHAASATAREQVPDDG